VVVAAGGRLSLSVIIPAYNEQSRLGETLVADYLARQPWDWEIRVVDDGSKDATAALVETFAMGRTNVLVQREPHRGKGGAVRAGMLASRAGFRFMCDADLAMPIHFLSRFLPPTLAHADIAIGTREGMRGRRIGEPLYRHIVGRMFNAVVQSLALPGIEDSQCGFKMFTADAATTIFQKATVDGWAFDVEVLTIARQLGLAISEVPIEWRFGGESKVRVVTDGLRMLREVAQIRTRARAGVYGRPPRHESRNG